MTPLFSRLFPATAPLASRFARRADGLAAPELLLHDRQVEVEEVAPAEDAVQPPVFFDPDDWNRVTRLQPDTTLETEMRRIGGGPVRHSPTLRFRVRRALTTPRGFFTATRQFGRQGGSPLRMTLHKPLAHLDKGFLRPTLSAFSISATS